MCQRVGPKCAKLLPSIPALSQTQTPTTKNCSKTSESSLSISVSAARLRGTHHAVKEATSQRTNGNDIRPTEKTSPQDRDRTQNRNTSAAVRRVVSCRVVSCRVVSCLVLSCHVMSCHAMSCHLSFVICHLSCHMSCVMPYIICHKVMPKIICQMSDVRCQMSDVMSCHVM